MEYTISAFTDRLRELMYDRFPYMKDEALNRKKHPNRQEHIRDVAFMNLPIGIEDNGNVMVFNIGSEFAEEKYPYYHILEDAPFIRKRGRGTDKTKGSQAQVQELGKRDYGRVSFNGKTYSKEYSRNIRGERAKLMRFNADRYITIGDKVYRANRNANYYENIHYQYIEKMLDTIAPIIAAEFNLRTTRKQSTGLQEEYEAQEKGLITDILESFE